MPISNEVELEFRRLLSKADANGRFTETLIDFMNKFYAMGYEEARDEYEMDCDQCSRIDPENYEPERDESRD